jgi:putative endonuclease
MGNARSDSLVIPRSSEESLGLGMKQYFVYIMSSKSGTLYTGMTNDLQKRVYQHKNKLFEGFTSKYDVNRLVYFETFGDVRDAIAREKQIKSWRRSKKLALIESMNRKWQDLSEEWD